MVYMTICFTEKEFNELMDSLFEAYGGADLLEDEDEPVHEPSPPPEKEPSPEPAPKPPPEPR